MSYICKEGDVVRRNCDGCEFAPGTNPSCRMTPKSFTVLKVFGHEEYGLYAHWGDYFMRYCPASQLSLAREAVVVGNTISLENLS